MKLNIIHQMFELILKRIKTSPPNPRQSQREVFKNSYGVCLFLGGWSIYFILFIFGWLEYRSRSETL